MKTFYRVSTHLSPNPNPLGTDKKYILDTCYKSFLKAGGKNITFIANDMPDDWFPKGMPVVKVDKIGSMANLAKVVEEVWKLPDNEKVFIVEDDYLWLPDTFDRIEKALDVLPIVSPYDHPGHYLEDGFKNQTRKMVLIDNHTWRQAPSNTHTFACKAGIIKANDRLLLTSGDHEFFTNLGIDIYVPVPSFATHLVTGLLAPNIDWGITDEGKILEAPKDDRWTLPSP